MSDPLDDGFMLALRAAGFREVEGDAESVTYAPTPPHQWEGLRFSFKPCMEPGMVAGFEVTATGPTALVQEFLEAMGELCE